MLNSWWMNPMENRNNNLREVDKNNNSRAKITITVALKAIGNNAQDHYKQWLTLDAVLAFTVNNLADPFKTFT